jgi:hypothetical protein
MKLGAVQSATPVEGLKALQQDLTAPAETSQL